MKQKKLAFPHVYVLLLGLVIFVGLLTYIVPAGTYDFVEVGGQSVIDPDSFHYIDQTPVSLWNMLLSIPQGMVKQANLIFCTFIVTGGLEILNRTGALEATIGRIAASQKKRLWLAVPLFMIPFTINHRQRADYRRRGTLLRLAVPSRVRRHSVADHSCVHHRIHKKGSERPHTQCAVQ